MEEKIERLARSQGLVDTPELQAHMVEFGPKHWSTAVTLPPRHMLAQMV